nr:hypothetical protein [Calditrichia bacterium]
MLRKTTFLLVLLFLAGCSAYKELKPKPEVVAQEGEYIELRKGDKNFELKKDKRYFLSFPAVAEPNFYLVLQSADLPRLTTYLTRVKPKKDQNPVKMDDQDSNASNDVFALDGTVASFYWVVEGIREDMKPSISYRYMPIWRYRFETKSAEFQLTLEQNRVGRQEFDGLGTTVPISDIVPGSKLSDAQRKNDVLKGIQGEMLEIESIFPPRIRNSNDKAYLAYQDFRAELNEELQFQENYMALMQALKTERDTRGRPGDFIAASGDFLNFFERSNSYPANVQEAVKRAVGQRLPDLTNYVDQQVRQKRDASPINIPIANLRQLYEATGRRPDRRFSDLADFIDLYNRNAESVAAAAKGADAIRADINKIGSWPGNDVYPQLARRADQLISPGASSSATYGGYAPLPAVTALTREAAQAARRLSANQADAVW